jgi:hypothetical protein
MGECREIASSTGLPCEVKCTDGICHVHKRMNSAKTKKNSAKAKKNSAKAKKNSVEAKKKSAKAKKDSVKAKKDSVNAKKISGKAKKYSEATFSRHIWRGNPQDNPYIQSRSNYKKESFHSGMELKRGLPFLANREIQMNQEALDLIYDNLETANLLVDGDHEEHMRMKETYRTLSEDQMKLTMKYDLLFEDQQNIYTNTIRHYKDDSDTDASDTD